MKDNEKQIKGTRNIAVEIPVCDDLKDISEETGVKIKELTSRVLKKFVKDYSKDKTAFTKLSIALNKESL